MHLELEREKLTSPGATAMFPNFRQTVTSLFDIKICKQLLEKNKSTFYGRIGTLGSCYGFGLECSPKVSHDD